MCPVCARERGLPTEGDGVVYRLSDQARDFKDSLLVQLRLLVKKMPPDSDWGKAGSLKISGPVSASGGEGGAPD